MRQYNIEAQNFICQVVGTKIKNASIKECKLVEESNEYYLFFPKIAYYRNFKIKLSKTQAKYILSNSYLKLKV